MLLYNTSRAPTERNNVSFVEFVWRCWPSRQCDVSAIQSRRPKQNYLLEYKSESISGYGPSTPPPSLHWLLLTTLSHPEPKPDFSSSRSQRLIKIICRSRSLSLRDYSPKLKQKPSRIFLTRAGANFKHFKRSQNYRVGAAPGPRQVASTTYQGVRAEPKNCSTLVIFPEPRVEQ